MDNRLPDAVILQFDQLTGAKRQLSAEAIALEEREGKNLYSEYLIKHGHRPPPKAAATIGQLMGRRVKASDGKKYPRLTNADRDAKRAKRAYSRKQEQVWRLRNALLLLAANQEDFESPIQAIWPSDEAVISANLEKAVTWLTRFAEEWNSRVHERESSQAADQSARALFNQE
jgi:hypothetical protein